MLNMLTTYDKGWFTALILAVLLACSATVQSAVLIEEDFSTTLDHGEVITGGMFLPALFSWGWTVELSEDESLNPGNIYLPLDDQWPVSSGALELVTERIASPTSPGQRNCLLNLTDPDGKPLLSLYVTWHTTFPGETFLYLNGLDTLVPASPNQAISLGREVKVGQYLQLLLSWDRGKGMVSLYANGEEIEVFQRPLIHRNMDPGDVQTGTLTGSDPGYSPVPVSSVVFSSMPSGDGEERDSSHLYSAVLDRFRVFDRPMQPSELLAETSVHHNGAELVGYSGALVAGQTLDVTLEAEEHGRATFDLGDIKSVPMMEVPDNPGIYKGTYTVAFGDMVESTSVTGHFVSAFGVSADAVESPKKVALDGRVRLEVNTDEGILPADSVAATAVKVKATDANGRNVKDHQVTLTLSTTDEYTGVVGGGNIEETLGSGIDVSWGGVTDSFGEVDAKYTSGFAAKTILISARDMVSGDVGAGYVRSFIRGTVDIVVRRPSSRSLSLPGHLEVNLSREWLTADGRSRSRVTAIVTDDNGHPVAGHKISFTLLGDNGRLRKVQDRTDSRGKAMVDYIAGTVMGQVQIDVRDMSSGLSRVVTIELRPDAPAEISLTAEPAEIYPGGKSSITALVTDINGNPNRDIDINCRVISGEGHLAAENVGTSEDGRAIVIFTGTRPGIVTVEGTVTSRPPDEDELGTATGAIFLYGLEEDPGRLEVVRWLVAPGQEVERGQPTVELEGREGALHIVKAPRSGKLSVPLAEERDRVVYGQTLGYILDN